MRGRLGTSSTGRPGSRVGSGGPAGALQAQVSLLWGVRTLGQTSYLFPSSAQGPTRPGLFGRPHGSHLGVGGRPNSESLSTEAQLNKGSL